MDSYLYHSCLGLVERVLRLTFGTLLEFPIVVSASELDGGSGGFLDPEGANSVDGRFTVPSVMDDKGLPPIS